jgi:hypothetical protein
MGVVSKASVHGRAFWGGSKQIVGGVLTGDVDLDERDGRLVYVTSCGGSGRQMTAPETTDTLPAFLVPNMAGALPKAVRPGRKWTPGGPYFHLLNDDGANGFDVVTSNARQILDDPEDFTTATWTKDGVDPPTVSGDAATDPLGGSTADVVTFAPTADGVTSRLVQNLTPATLDTTKSHVLSFWVRNLEAFDVRLHVLASSSTAWLGYVPADGAWHLIAGIPAEVDDEAPRIQKFEADDGGFDVALWGAQMTEGPVWWDYVPSTQLVDIVTVSSDRATSLYLGGAPIAGVSKPWFAGSLRTFSVGAQATIAGGT